MGKRSHEDINVDEIIDSINLDKGLRAAFSDLTPDEQAVLLADLANSANLPNATLKKTRVDLPSLSAVKWSEFAIGLWSVGRRFISQPKSKYSTEVMWNMKLVWIFFVQLCDITW
jgi:hypothetical protein